MMASGVASPNTRWPPADLLAGADHVEHRQAEQDAQDPAVHAGGVVADQGQGGQGRAEKEGEGEPLDGPVLANDHAQMPVPGKGEQRQVGADEQREQGVDQGEQGGFLHGFRPGAKGIVSAGDRAEGADTPAAGLLPPAHEKNLYETAGWKSTPFGSGEAMPARGGGGMARPDGGAAATPGSGGMMPRPGRIFRRPAPVQ